MTYYKDRLRVEVKYQSIYGSNVYGSYLYTRGGREVGSFTIRGQGFNTGETMFLNIFIDDQYIGRQYARLMINKLVEFIKTNIHDIRHDQLLYIDTDASAGFWRHIGMKGHRYAEKSSKGISSNRKLEGLGCELEITMFELERYNLMRLLNSNAASPPAICANI